MVSVWWQSVVFSFISESLDKTQNVCFASQRFIVYNRPLNIQLFTCNHDTWNFSSIRTWNWSYNNVGFILKRRPHKFQFYCENLSAFENLKWKIEEIHCHFNLIVSRDHIYFFSVSIWGIRKEKLKILKLTFTLKFILNWYYDT